MEKQFHPFDFYDTDMSFYYDGIKEKLELSDYGLSYQDACQYTELIKNKRDEAHARYRIYEHRCLFFKALAVFLCFCIFIEIIGYYNDFLRENDVFYDILKAPFYLGLAWLLYKGLYMKLSFVIENVKENVEKSKRYPNDGHPNGYDSRIERYFDDILWNLYKRNMSARSV